VKELLKYFLNNPIGIRAIMRAIKNIFNYDSDARLRTFCRVLNTYRERILKKREAATSERIQIYKIQIQPRKEQQRKRKLKGQLSSIQRQIDRKRFKFIEIITPPEKDWADGSQEK
jgi:hypothetical protein